MAGGLEHVDRADHVGLGAGDRIGLAERHLQGGEVNDRADLVLRHRGGDRLGIGDVAGEPRRCSARPRSSAGAAGAGRPTRSNATAGTPAWVSSASAQLPMQPPAPVTSTGPSKLALSTGKRASSCAASLSGPRPTLREIPPRGAPPAKKARRVNFLHLYQASRSFGKGPMRGARPVVAAPSTWFAVARGATGAAFAGPCPPGCMET